jgi:hypothetical protein
VPIWEKGCQQGQNGDDEQTAKQDQPVLFGVLDVFFNGYFCPN